MVVTMRGKVKLWQLKWPLHNHKMLGSSPFARSIAKSVPLNSNLWRKFLRNHHSIRSNLCRKRRNYVIGFLVLDPKAYTLLHVCLILVQNRERVIFHGLVWVCTEQFYPIIIFSFSSNHHYYHWWWYLLLSYHLSSIFHQQDNNIVLHHGGQRR